MIGIAFFPLKLLIKLLAALYGAEGINIALTALPTQLMALVLRRYGAQIGSNVRFRSPLTVHNGALKPDPYYANLSVGSNCYFGRNLLLDLGDRVTVEDNVTISHRVTILTHTDVGESPLKNSYLHPSAAPVTLRYGAYIGAGATILQGVEIGACAVVAAGALVNRSVPPYTVVGGVPARHLRDVPRLNPAEREVAAYRNGRGDFQ